MAVYAYPAVDYDNPATILQLAGSFWSLIYDDRDQLLVYTEGQARLWRQVQQDLEEYRQAHSRHAIPVWHTELRTPLILRESDMSRDPRRLAAYAADSLAFSNTVRYGQTKDVDGYAFPAPANVQAVTAITNRLTSPSVTLTQGLDFTVRDGLIIFRHNPLDDPNIPTRVTQPGLPSQDRKSLLWLHDVSVDWNYLHTHFGYVLGIKMQSSAGYKALLNAMYNAITGCTSKQDIVTLLAVTLGIRLAETTETVEVVDTTDDVMIITDRHVYRYPAVATPLVGVGDVVTAGQPLVDALRVFELNRGDIAEIPRLTLGRGLLGGDYLSDLTFENATKTWTVSTDADGHVRAEFPINGFEQDVRSFWDATHARGVAAGRTLADMLDTRSQPVGPPTIADVPATVNPLNFLVENLLHANLFVVHAKIAGARNGLGMQWSRLLRRILPPHATLVMVIEMQLLFDSVTMAGDEDTATAMLGMEPLVDSFDTAFSDDTALTPRITSVECQ